MKTKLRAKPHSKRSMDKIDRGYYCVCLEQPYPQTHVSMRRMKKAWKKIDANLAAVPAGRIEAREMRYAREAALLEINDRIGC